VTEHEDYQTPPFTYSGERVMEKFFDHIFKEAKTISDILSQNVPMTPLTDDEWREFNRATTCRNCNESFSFGNPKTRHHSHVSGRYLFPACSNCNLALKPRKSKFSSDISDDDEEGGVYLLPCIFHNLGYDGHFILQFFQKQYTEYTTKNGQTRYADVGVIPLNGERNLLLKIGSVVFVDTYQFLAASLDDLVTDLHKSGVDDFVHTIRHFGRDDLFFHKGIYPYDYMSDESKFLETALPPKSAFYNHLHEEDISDEQYERA